MNDSYFTSSVLSSFVDYLKEGSAFYIIAGIIACIAYGILYNSLAHDKKIIKDRSSGKLLTNALFLRQEFKEFSKLNDTKYWTNYIIKKLTK